MMVVTAPIDTDKLKNLMAEIRDNIQALQAIVAMSPRTFLRDRTNYAVAEHHFRRALEGILTVGTHLLSRIPAKSKDYQEIITALGKHGIVPEDFAERNRKLAGYRNRLVHLYWEVSEQELHDVIKQHIKDLEQFCEYFVQYIRSQQSKKSQ